jgi:hypothetical protein
MGVKPRSTEKGTMSDSQAGMEARTVATAPLGRNLYPIKDADGPRMARIGLIFTDL